MGKYGRMITAGVEIEMTAASSDAYNSLWLPGPALITSITVYQQKQFTTTDEYIEIKPFWSPKRGATVQAGDIPILPLLEGPSRGRLLVGLNVRDLPVELYVPLKQWSMLVQWWNTAALTDNLIQVLIHFELIGNEPLPIL